MIILLFGATGMVGQGVLRECLRASDVELVQTVGRTATAQHHSKLREVVHRNLLDYQAIEPELRNFDACFFCLGASSAGLKEAEYTRLTYDLTLAAAQTLARFNPQRSSGAPVLSTSTVSPAPGPTGSSATSLSSRTARRSWSAPTRCGARKPTTSTSSIAVTTCRRLSKRFVTVYLCRPCNRPPPRSSPAGRACGSPPWGKGTGPGPTWARKLLKYQSWTSARGVAGSRRRIVSPA